MIMRKRKGSRAAALALSLCIACTSALSAGAGSLAAYAAEQEAVDEGKSTGEIKSDEETKPAENLKNADETKTDEKSSDAESLKSGANSQDENASKTTQSAEEQKDPAKTTGVQDTETVQDPAKTTSTSDTDKSQNADKAQNTEKTQEPAKSENELESGKTQAAENTQTTTAVSGTNHAVIVHLADGYSLDAVPKQDAESLQKILYNTDQFDKSKDSIKLLSIPENDEKNDYKAKIWAEIDEIAKDTDENSFTVFAYSGHGGALGDGTSSLALGGINNISAAELRQHLNKLSGRVFVILSCCHSGGMIMPATEFDETGDVAAQTADAFDEEEFLEEFFNQENEISLASETGDVSDDTEENGNDNSVRGEASSVTKEPPQYYFFAAANRAETATQLEGIGGQDNAALGHALGFDRNNANYHVFAADTTTLEGGTSREGYAGDGKVTMRELADFYQKYNRITSSPVLYPAESEDVLFTYGEASGTPASFICSIPQQNVSVDANGTISITATVTNLTDHKITVGAGVYDWGTLTFALTTASRGKSTNGAVMKPEDGYGYMPALNEEGGWDEYYVNPNSEGEITYKFTWDEFLEGVSDGSENPFCLKIWDCTEDAADADGYGPIGTYRLLSFYTAAADGETNAIDPDALSLNKPIQFTAGKAGETYTVTKTSSQLPIEIVFDSENETKLTNAACKLWLYASDLGTKVPDGIHVAPLGSKNDDKVLKDKNNKIISSEESDWSAVFEDVQPSYERRGNSGNQRGSVYTYIMDTSKLQQGHYYALRVVCRDTTTDKDKHIYALIQRTDAASAEEYQIPEFKLSEDHWNYFRNWDGIMVDATWNGRYDDKWYYADGAGDLLRQTLQLQDGGAQYTYAVTNWKKLVSSEPEKWTAMGKTERFEAGGTYQCDIVVTINEGYNAVFTDDTVFDADHHKLRHIDIQDAGKKVVLTVEHEIATQKSLDSTTVQLRRVTLNGNQTTIEDAVAQTDETLHPRDTVILVPGKDCAVFTRGGLTDAGRSVRWNGTDYKIYKVSEIEKGKTALDILISVWKDEEDNCGCSLVMRSWVAHPETEGGDDSSDTDKKDDSSGSDQTDSGSSGESSSGGSPSGSSTSGASAGQTGSASAEQSKSAWQVIPDKAAEGQAVPVTTADAAEQNAQAAPAQTAGNASKANNSHAASGVKTTGSAGGDDAAKDLAVVDASEDTLDADSEEVLSSGDASVEVAEAQKAEGAHTGGSAAVKSVVDTNLILWLLGILAAAVGVSIFIILLYKRRKEEE